ncbi:NAD(P)H-binding protein [Flavobacterium franklandianum]|uniref:SDR family NAD(P)-dependent oxidoreductase n=1 Tax=Flavobacterium franklandianum TaxID=2594430 RepID=A0A553CT08_9FLAO|nr:NAD(P)H-binding protein [Flavobacterium franklandianum]TRX23639.1 SDR family NAD(P)-dependent oxidoreductase [Flavobacterium franklandianum]
MTQISILGCGWLGLPLAKALLENDFSVKGSTTSVEKISVLENLGIQPYLIALSENETVGNLNDFLENSTILIIDIPPKLRGSATDPSTALRKTFVEKIKNLIPSIENSSIENVLFISSTSVYGDTSTALSVTEETELNPDTESGKQLVQSEQLLQSNSNFKTTILRFGGLIGEDRHPIKFLAGRKNIENPNAPINLIHQEDCIGIVIKILRTPEVSGQNDKSEWNDTFNAVAPFHPSRKEYYTQKAIDLNLDLPEFNAENSISGKTILSTKIENVLEYTFAKPHL